MTNPVDYRDHKVSKMIENGIRVCDAMASQKRWKQVRASKNQPLSIGLNI